jgi:hypothetical protein
LLTFIEVPRSEMTGWPSNYSHIYDIRILGGFIKWEIISLGFDTKMN